MLLAVTCFDEVNGTINRRKPTRNYNIRIVNTAKGWNTVRWIMDDKREQFWKEWFLRRNFFIINWKCNKVCYLKLYN